MQSKHSGKLVKHSDWKPGMLQENFYYLNFDGDTIIRLDSELYSSCNTDTFINFAVVSFHDKPGWWAIDRDQKVLFQVYNAYLDEPSPDELQDGFIRIINEDNKIGFANHQGKIAIRPQYEFATPFKNGRSIVGYKCTINSVEEEFSDKHSEVQCEEYVLINNKGEALSKHNQFDSLALNYQ